MLVHWFRRLPSRAGLFALVVFVAAFSLFWTYPQFGGFETIHGDNIGQVSYFKVVLHPRLAGSNGGTSMKPALIALLAPRTSSLRACSGRQF